MLLVSDLRPLKYTISYKHIMITWTSSVQDLI